MPATFPQTLWVLAERGLTVTVGDDRMCRIEGDAAQITPDLREDCRRWKDQIVALHEQGEPLTGPHECPGWRLFLLAPWTPRVMIWSTSKNAKIWVPYRGDAVSTEQVQMTLMRDPHSHVKAGVSVPGGSFVDWAIAWKWLDEPGWRPTPRVK